jgi:2-keto-3-deoxy-L-fuconate dehydrogenase
MGAMELDRLNPVVLVTGAASGLGAALAQEWASRAGGGLILVDGEAGALDAAADSIETAPERVSTLAFDVADQSRWVDAVSFIEAQYGRLDYALVNVSDGEGLLTDKRLQARDRGAAADLDAAFLSLRALIRLMGANSQGGAIVLTCAAATITDAPSGGLVSLLRVAAREAAAAQVRVNAIAIGAPSAAIARRAPSFHEIEHELGDEAAVLDLIARLPAPLARHDGDDVAALIVMLLANPCSGIALVVEAAAAL